MPYTYEFPRPALAADVVALTSESVPRILLIQRRDDPYAGRWALPGGFVNENEPLLAAAQRELKEESGLVFESLEQFRSYGDPGRDPRGWIVSVIYFARVNEPIPIPQAGDDAKNADWFPLDRLPSLAFDHATIIQEARKFYQ